MLRYLNIIYNYCKCISYLGYIYTFRIDIQNNDIWIMRLKNTINESGFMMIKCIQWILPSYNLLYPDTKLYTEFKKYYDKCYIHDIKYT